MAAGHAYIALPYYLMGMADDRFSSMRGSSRASKERDMRWPEAFQYLPRSYATGRTIHQAVHSFGKRSSFGVRRKQCTLCGSIWHSAQPVMCYPLKRGVLCFSMDLTLPFEHWLRDTGSKFAKLTYLAIVHYAQAKGDARRAR